MRSPPAPAFDALLLHTGSAPAALATLCDDLAERGLAILARGTGRGAPPVPQSVAQQLCATRSVLVVVGGDGAGPWENSAVRTALQRAVAQRAPGLPVIPVLLAGAARPDLPPLVCNRAWIDLDRSAPATALDCLVSAITGRKHRPRAIRPAALPPAPDNRIAFAPPPAPADREPPPCRLEEIIPGAWQLRIQTPFAIGTLQAVFTPQGTFRGELLTPAGRNLVDGRWHASTADRRIRLAGRQAAGLHVAPYEARVAVTFFNPQQIVGTTARGEQMTWHKQAPAA
ncbi:MAG TPA: hypothetical protein PK322_10565 [Opitutaceae bacterium]|nr:hypothetical protein [Opitutaceae bacterium]